MPIIYDNIEIKLVEGLNRTLESSFRSDFCNFLKTWHKTLFEEAKGEHKDLLRIES